MNAPTGITIIEPKSSYGMFSRKPIEDEGDTWTHFISRLEVTLKEKYCIPTGRHTLYLGSAELIEVLYDPTGKSKCTDWYSMFFSNDSDIKVIRSEIASIYTRGISLIRQNHNYWVVTNTAYSKRNSELNTIWE